MLVPVCWEPWVASRVDRSSQDEHPARLTLIGIVRGRDFEVSSHPTGIAFDEVVSERGMA